MKDEIISKDIIRTEAELSGKADGLSDTQFDKLVDSLYKDINDWAFSDMVWRLTEEYMAENHPNMPEMVEMKEIIDRFERAQFEAGLNKREGWPV